MRKIAVCDDQFEIIEYISEVCRKFYDGKKNLELSFFHTGEELLKSKQHFDVIFMDVEMENINGIETGMEIRKTDHDVLIIMISGYEKYKFNAYSLHAFDFLNKPLSELQIFDVLNEVERYCTKKKDFYFVSFKIKDGYIKIDISDILYFEYINRKIKIRTINNSYEFYDNIGTLATKMKNLGFGVPHRAYIVNLMHVQKIKNNEIILDNNKIIPMTKYKIKEFKNDYALYLKNQIKQWEE